VSSRYGPRIAGLEQLAARHPNITEAGLEKERIARRHRGKFVADWVTLRGEGTAARACRKRLV